MAKRLNAVAPRYSVADRRRRRLPLRGRRARPVSRHGRGACMRLRRRAGGVRSRFRYPLSHARAQMAFENSFVS